MSVPPELMAALQSAGGGAAPAPDTAGVPPGVMAGIEQDAAGAEGQQTDRVPADALRDAISAMEEYRRLEQDDIDLAEAAKLYAGLQKMLAKEQQEREQAMGVTPAHKGMAQAYGTGPAA